MPFDFLLHALARDYGARCACVILSGSGTDGSLGLMSVKESAGIVIVQRPEEAGYDGMPRSAIATGAVDEVLAVAAIPAMLAAFRNRLARAGGQPFAKVTEDELQHVVSQIIELVREKTGHDFRLYKPGTLQRRIQRRMALGNIVPTNTDHYLAMLRSDKSEIDILVADLLINVTSFFRDPHVFQTLAETVIPELMNGHKGDQPLRIWIAGCSTGEEAYSLAMLFSEHIMAEKRNIKLAGVRIRRRS